jgi:hypothetical protein
MSETNRAPVRPQPATPTHAQLGYGAIKDPMLSPRGCKILWALTYWAWGRRPDCWPSNKQIAELTNYSPRSVQLGLAELVRLGHLYRRMVETKTGWHRVLTLAERHSPELQMIEPQPAIGPLAPGAKACATPGAAPCATPAQRLAPPPAQEAAPQSSLKEGREKTELSSPSSPGESGTPTTAGRGPEAKARGDSAEGIEPEWMRVDQLNAADAERWREIRDQAGHPMRKIAVKILDRWARHHAGQLAETGFGLTGENTTASGSPARDHRTPPIEGIDPSKGNCTNLARTSQDKCQETEHKTH